MTKKKLARLYKFALIIGLPVSLYTFVYATNVENPRIESALEAIVPSVPVAVASTVKPVVLAKNPDASTVKKPVAKKAPVKKKVAKKKTKKKKERLIAEPALITPETAPHTGR
jgi:hypothetical protein